MALFTGAFFVALLSILFIYKNLNMMVPKEAATHTGEIKKGWTSYRDTAIKNLQPDNFVSNEYLTLGA